mgnify:CR=1 FL=1
MSYNNWCNSVGPAVAENLVILAHDKFINQGTVTYNQAVDRLNNLGNISLDPVSFSIDYDFDGTLAPFVRPIKPTLNLADFGFQPPDAIAPAPHYSGNVVLFDPAPLIDAAAPSLVFAPKPVHPIVSVPIAPAPPGAVVIPIEPTYALPDVPSFELLNLPATPNIVLPTFDTPAPTFQQLQFNETWDFVPEDYVRVLLDDLVTAIRPMLQSNPALPAHIEAAIFQRGRSRIEVEVNRSIESAITDFGGRGFDAPQGMLNATAMELRQQGVSKVAEVARDTAIEQYKETLANLRFALTNGVAIEGVFVQLHLEENRLALQAAQFQRDGAVAFLNARIAVMQAENANYLAQASVFETRIRATLATIEVFKAQIDGEKARGEINEQKVRLYEAMLRGVTVMAEFHKTRLEGIRIKVDADKGVVDRYKAEVDAYDSRMRAYGTEWTAWGIGTEAEGKKADIYKTLVDSQVRRVDGWDTTQKLKLEQERLGIQQHGQRLEAWRGDVTRFSATMEGERARLAAVGQRVAAQAEIYRSEAQVETAASAATDRSFELALAAARTDADIQMKRADMLMQQASGLIDQAIAIAKAQADVASQLAASTMSAVGYSASVSSSNNQSKSCASNFNFQGETIDA